MTTSTLQIILVPLDERPVNTRYPQMLGQIGGAEILMPPAVARGLQRTPADVTLVSRWLQHTSNTATAAIVSCDYFGYGNLINARISNHSAAAVLARLAVLAEVNTQCPVHAFSLITRVSNADDAVEEPEYWAIWGTRFYRYARLKHQAELNALPDQASERELAQLETELPADLKTDWLVRRLRNHTVNLGLMDMAARDSLTSLLLTSDDTSAYGFPTRERDWLRAWPNLIGPDLTDRLQMYPGADEVGSALVAKLINEKTGTSPKIWIEYSMPEDCEIVAPYEDRPVRETVLGQINACGCSVATSGEESDIVLGVVTPSPRRSDYRLDFLKPDTSERTAPYREFLGRLAAWQEQGKPIAIADVAYPNGSDPLFTDILFAKESSSESLNPPVLPSELIAYGAWNTAGNTLGVVVAQASCALHIDSIPERIRAYRKFLAHRFLEDCGYQFYIRREARADAEARWGRREPDPNSPEEQKITCQFIEKRLGEFLQDLQTQGIGNGLRIAEGSVFLPWKRTFEVDFELV